MKKLVEVQEVPNEGLIALMGEVVTLFCMNYFYSGRLIGVNDDCVLLENCKIVYETGPFTEKHWKEAQALPNPKGHYVMKAAIESFGLVKE